MCGEEAVVKGLLWIGNLASKEDSVAEYWWKTVIIH